MGKRYNNYHRHTHYSNISTLDCCVKPIDYINRAKELGHTTYFTTEHGWQGNIYEAHKLCLENDLKPIYGVEAYYVDNMNEKDSRKTYHIIIIAMTNNGRKQINKIISRAYSDGFYYKPRIDLECLLSLNPNDVVVTTACIATRLFKGGHWKENFFLPLLNHFGNHFFLEVQDHNHKTQKELNKNILDLHEEYGVKLIHGCDSHYIYPKDAKIRNMFLNAKGMNYGDEDSFVLDYPDYDDILKRYKEQGILTKSQAIEAIDNTLIFDEAEPIELDFEFKLPKIFKEDSTSHLRRIILEEFKKKIPYRTMTNEMTKKYIEAINYEYNIIIKCHMEDYFLLDYYIVKKAVEDYGAILTRTGRGSAVSFLINYLLGFTQIDRLKSPIKLYPTRFMSAERILNTRSLPDIDLNWADVKPVLKASKDYLGEDGVYYMVSYKPLQESSAFRLWCKAKGMHISEYNEVAKDLDLYKDDKKWNNLIQESKAFVGVIESVSPSPCSVLLLDKPISEEVGLIKVGDVMCCALDGYYCDYYKFLKNDYLIVSVYTLINETYKLIGRPIDDISTLLKNCDDKVWDLIGNGITTTINQCDSDYDKQILKKYRPRNLAELSGYVASIRPGFASLLNNFIERKPYTTGVKELDELLTDSFHYLMYQENIMTYLTWLGVDEKETYDIIKKISKKKFKQKELEELKSKLHAGWIQQVGKEEGFNETWEVVEDASKYSFNASHSLSVALDALYGAYLKSHYPLEYFTVALTEYSHDEARTKNLIKELNYFNIKLQPILFRKSSSNYVMNKETNEIYKGIKSIKYCNKNIAEELYSLGENKYDDFVDLYIDIKNKTSVNSKQLNTLILLNYFKEFGKNKKLLDICKILSNIITKKQFSKSKLSELGIPEGLIKKYSSKETKSLYKEVDVIGLAKDLFNNIEDKSVSAIEQYKAENEYLGYIDTTYPNMNDKYYYVKDISITSYRTVYLSIRNFRMGKEYELKIKNKNLFVRNPIDKGCVIKVDKIVEHFKKRKNEEGKWVAINETELCIDDYSIIKK